jgi:hypothetical protein
MTLSGICHGGKRWLSLPAESLRQDDDSGRALSRRLRLGRSLNGRLRWRFNRSWRSCDLFQVFYPASFRLRSSISPHNRGRTNAENGAKQRSPRRPQEEYENKRKHQKRFSKSWLCVAFIIDIEQQCEERSHFNTLASSTPRPTPNIKRPLAAITPTATQRRTADRE